MRKAGKRTILVVEDDDSIRRLIARVLEDDGMVPLPAGSASEGLSLFEGHNASIDLAIIDMVMPGMSGLDLAAELERRRPGMRILYISGYVESVAMECVARRDPDLVLLKPFNGTTLMARVQSLLPAAKTRRGIATS